MLALSNLRYAVSLNKPFFIGMGMFKPHYPWHVPQQFVDLYNTATLSPPAHPLFPSDAPQWAFDHGLDAVTTFELLNTSSAGGLARVPVPGFNATTPMPLWVYSAMSWADHLVGMMLDEIDDLNITNTTLVVLTSDHGYHLGELALWAKQTCYEDATHVPLTIRVPWFPASSTAGQHSNSFFELMDLFLTIAELAGLPVPPGLDGTSQAAAVRDPTQMIKQRAFSQFPR